MRRISIRIISIIALLLAADQLTKYLIRRQLQPGDSIEIASFLRLDHVENRGMAFGFMDDHGGVIVFVSAMVLLVLVTAILAVRDEGRVFLPLALLVAGSSGNLIDRFVRGSVTDFVHFPYWPAFNLADIYIVLGVIFLVRVLILTPGGDSRRG